MRPRLIALSLLVSAGALSHAAANAEVLRCGDGSRKTLYTDSACPAGMHAIGVPALPQSCSSEECQHRRDREFEAAHERARAEKEQLAAYTIERHRQEIEDRWIDVARYEAQLRSMQSVPVSSDEVFYPTYPLAGYPSRCGKRCLTPRHHRVGQPTHHPAHRAAPEPRRASRVMRDR